MAPRSHTQAGYLHSDEAAKLADVATATWTHNSRDPQSAIPEPTKRCGTCGHWLWRELVVKRYLDAKSAPPAQKTHDAIVRLIDGKRSESDIAFRLGIHWRTVRRHLHGECSCAPLDV